MWFSRLISVVLILVAQPFFVMAQEIADEQGPLSIAIDKAYSPYSLIGPTGESTGLTVEIWRAWSDATGTPIEFVPSGWEGTLEALRSGKVDVHSGMFKNASRAEWADFSEPIHQIHTALFFRAGSGKPVALEKLAGERVGVWAGTYQHQFLKDNYPQIELVTSASDDELILKLLNGEVRAILNEVPSVEADLAAFGIRGVLVRNEENLFSNTLHPAVRKGDRELLERINAGLRKISTARLHELEKLWLPNPSDHFFTGADGQIEFTPEEETWLATNPVVKLAVTTFIRPVDILDKAGKYTGLNADLIALLNKKLGINIVPEFFDSWGDVVAAAMDGTVNGAFSLSITPEREKSVLFTKPYAFDPIIAIVSRSSDDIEGWKGLEGKTVTVVKGASIIEEVFDMIGDGVLVKVETEIDGMKAVAAGVSDVHVSWLIPYGNAQRTHPIDGLKIALTRNSEGGTLRIGIHKDSPELLGILRKGLNAISREEMIAVRNKWLFATPGAADEMAKINLTQEEISWINSHPEITLAATADWPPFEFKTEDGIYKGITAAVVRAAAARLGLAVKPVFKPWETELDMLRRGELDLAPGLYVTEDRKDFLLFTRSFIEFYDTIYTQADRDDIHAMVDLSGKKVAAEKSYAVTERIKANYPDITVIPVINTLEALKLVSAGQADAYIGNQVVATHLINSNLLQNVISAGFFSRAPQYLAMGVPKDRPLLRDIMDKALAAMTPAEMRAIKIDYLGTEEMKRSIIQLTQKERAWLKEHKTIRLGDDFAWPPFTFMDEKDQFAGIAAGYTEILSERLGIELEPVTGLTWKQVMEKIKTGGVDILPAVAQTEARKEFINFTKPYITLPIVVATRKDGVFVDNLGDLTGMKVGVVEGYVTQEILAKNHPGLVLVPVKSLNAGLHQLDDRKIEAFVDNLGSITYEIDKQKLVDIKIAAPTDYRFELSFGVRKDWPQLAQILDKTLDTIGDKERAVIKNTWMAIEVKFGLDLKTILIWALPIGSSALLIIIFVVVWNRRLGEEVRERKEAQRKLKEAFAVITSSIQYASRIQRSVLPDTSVIENAFADHFVLWEPRDVVGGDMYWCAVWGDGVLFVLGDCTGHGVPGAFMTLIASGALERAMADVPTGDVAGLLKRMNQLIQVTLGQKDKAGESDDGMELGACWVDSDQKIMTFAGARFDLFIVEDGSVSEIKGTKKGIGYCRISHTQEYAARAVPLFSGRRFYMTSDGLIDQVGGPKRRMFGKKRFRNLLLSFQDLPMNDQKDRIWQALIDYQGDESRRDDVAVAGFRF